MKSVRIYKSNQGICKINSRIIPKRFGFVVFAGFLATKFYGLKVDVDYWKRDYRAFKFTYEEWLDAKPWWLHLIWLRCGFQSLLIAIVAGHWNYEPVWKDTFRDRSVYSSSCGLSRTNQLYRQWLLYSILGAWRLSLNESCCTMIWLKMAKDDILSLEYKNVSNIAVSTTTRLVE